MSQENTYHPIKENRTNVIVTCRHEHDNPCRFFQPGDNPEQCHHCDKVDNWRLCNSNQATIHRMINQLALMGYNAEECGCKNLKAVELATVPKDYAGKDGICCRTKQNEFLTLKSKTVLVEIQEGKE